MMTQGLFVYETFLNSEHRLRNFNCGGSNSTKPENVPAAKIIKKQ